MCELGHEFRLTRAPSWKSRCLPLLSMADSDTLALFCRLFGISGNDAPAFCDEVRAALGKLASLNAKREVLDQWLRLMGSLMDAEVALVNAFACRYTEALYAARVTDHGASDSSLTAPSSPPLLISVSSTVQVDPNMGSGECSSAPQTSNHISHMATSLRGLP